jgi:aminoglycoside 6-adenylyltransferase
MNAKEKESTVLQRLTAWAAGRADVRAMLLYSSRANPAAPVDVFSDYDVLLAVTDVRALRSDAHWLEDFGKVLVVFRNPIGLEHGFESFGFITHYEDGTKIDYGIYPVDYLRWVAQQPRLPDDLDDGYAVLLDKDHLTAGLGPPTYRAYLPEPPSQQVYQELVEEFFNDACYVARNLWRDNLFGVKLSLDHIMKFRCLRMMLEWQFEIAHGWGVKLGAHGKRLKLHISPGIWAELERTYAGASAEENWEALFRTVDLFRAVAVEVAAGLGFTYPHDMDRRVIAHLRRVRGMQPG